jgi:hypothetical protein
MGDKDYTLEFEELRIEDIFGRVIDFRLFDLKKIHKVRS